ncbi:sodium:alanine symporter family protein [Methanococcoides methylutens]|uniref:Sodium/glycine symporter GlyP n=1 Tax=Methanococcoides methylutens MM1 TaxID=1434104 RepID=A0A0E3SQR6_METMT|nr:sodium:alanine symporter family protein [Methanococcoides methylutens]AKB84402.1 Sodium/glycine symporter GlyP [Methanococcoides methylutens MM1]
MDFLNLFTAEPEMVTFLKAIDSLVWGPPLLLFLVGTGVYLTLSLGFIQVLRLPLALRYVIRPDPSDKENLGDISSFAALTTALAATIGTGNIVGVATAIKAGGPGALFWMWLAAFFGMATKYAECMLAVKYRTIDENGQMAGGPMHYITNGLSDKVYSKPLATFFAFSGICVAFFGIGIFPQVNAIADSAAITLNVPPIYTAVVITVLVAMVTIGGIRSISKVALVVVPFMAIAYVIGCLIIIATNLESIPSTIALIIRSAFTPTAAAGGFLGSTMILAIQMGIARGVFSNESGLGSAPIAAAAARIKEPAKQGLISMTGTFFDTIIVCTMTGIVLVMTGAWTSEYEGAYMNSYAFSTGIESIGAYIVGIGLMFFAFTTILGWNYYGERCVQFLVGVRGIMPYRIIYIALVGGGVFLTLDTIWILADIVNGLMVIPNLIALLALRKVIVKETRKYFDGLEEESKNY